MSIAYIPKEYVEEFPQQHFECKMTSYKRNHNIMGILTGHQTFASVINRSDAVP
jgi:hypothetical protein